MFLIKTYNYKGIKNNNVVFGEFVNLSKEQVLNKLKDDCVEIIYIRFSYAFKQNVSINKQIFFFNNIATHLKAKLMLSDSIDSMIKSENNYFQKILININSDLNNGMKLSDILIKYDFDKIVITLVKAGEQNGNMLQSVLQIISYLNKKKLFSDALKSAMIYPLIIFTVMIFVIQFISFILIDSIFAVIQPDKMPLVTYTFILFVKIINKFYYFIPVIVIIYFLNYKFTSCRMLVDKMKLKIPIISELIKRKNVFYFIYTFSILIKEEVKIFEAVNIATGVIDNMYMQKEFQKINNSIINGHNFSSAIKDNIFIDKIIKSIIFTGDKTASLKESLEYSAHYIENELSIYQKRSLKFLEPMIMIFIGIFIIFMLMSIILPIYSLFEMQDVL